MDMYRDHFVYLPSQWKSMLQCNVICHWLGPFTKWFVYLPSQWKSMLQCNVICHWLGPFTKWSLHVAQIVMATIGWISTDRNKPFQFPCRFIELDIYWLNIGSHYDSLRHDETAGIFRKAMSQNYHNISKHQQLDCLFNSLFRLTTTKTNQSYALSMREIQQWPGGFHKLSQAL